MRRKQAGQFFTLHVIQADGLPYTGDPATLTFYLEKDDAGNPYPLTPANGFVVVASETTQQPGDYDVGPTTAELTDGYKLHVTGVCSVPGVQVVGQTFFTTAGYVSAPGAGGLAGDTPLGGTLYLSIAEMTSDWGSSLLIDLTQFDRNVLTINETRLQEAILYAGGEIDAAAAVRGLQVPISASDPQEQRYLKELAGRGAMAWLYEHKPGQFKDVEGRPTNPGAPLRRTFNSELEMIRTGMKRFGSAPMGSPKVGMIRAYGVGRRRGMYGGSGCGGQQVVQTPGPW
jgi:hypothetical protein